MNGTPYKQYLAGRLPKRTLSYLGWAAVCVGSVSPDADHLISLLTGNPALWGILHQPLPLLLVWCVFAASGIGLCTSLVLKETIQ